MREGAGVVTPLDRLRPTPLPLVSPPINPARSRSRHRVNSAGLARPPVVELAQPQFENSPPAVGSMPKLQPFRA